MANEENLIPTNKRSKSEVREIGRKGGIKSGESRRKRKAVREIIEMVASQQVTNPKMVNRVRSIMKDIDEEDIDMLTYATAGMFMSSGNGNANAYRLLTGYLDESQAIEDMPEDDLSKSLRELGESL